MSHRPHLSVASALVTAGLLVAAGNAQALDAEISGHVNRAVMWAGDGENNDFFFVDNETSNSRFRFVGSEEILPGIKAGIKWEMEFVSNNSSKVNINDEASGNVSGDFDLNERHQDIYFQSQYGKLSFGQGDGANNGAAEVDLSGTAVANYSGAGDVGGSIQFADDGTKLDANIGDVYNQFDFESRYDRVRYDSPALGPVVLVGSFGKKGDDDTWEGGAKFSTDVPGIGKVAGAAGYASRNLSDDVGQEETFGGSVSFLSDLGPNLTVAYTMKENDDTDLDADTIYVKGGYKIGKHAISVDYGLTRDLLEDDIDGSFVGGGYVFKPKSWIELYAAVKVHMVDDDRNAAEIAASDDIGDLSDADDITIGMVGSRIKF